LAQKTNSPISIPLRPFRPWKQIHRLGTDANLATNRVILADLRPPLTLTRQWPDLGKRKKQVDSEEKRIATMPIHVDV
jgi:hypothetical protein